MDSRNADNTCAESSLNLHSRPGQCESLNDGKERKLFDAYVKSGASCATVFYDSPDSDWYCPGAVWLSADWTGLFDAILKGQDHWHQLGKRSVVWLKNAGLI